MRRIAGLLLVVALTACAMPSTVVRTPDTRPSLSFPDAPAGAILYLDGLQVGDVAKYNGSPATLRVEPGTHRVLLKAVDGLVLLDTKVFVESELKQVMVR